MRAPEIPTKLTTSFELSVPLSLPPSNVRVAVVDVNEVAPENLNISTPSPKFTVPFNITPLPIVTVDGPPFWMIDTPPELLIPPLLIVIVVEPEPEFVVSMAFARP